MPVDTPKETLIGQTKDVFEAGENSLSLEDRYNACLELAREFRSKAEVAVAEFRKGLS